jgi:tetratricopeptide (TPR) repeat protein
VVLVATLTCAAPPAFPEELSHAQAVAGLTHREPEKRAEALAWLAEHGTMADQPALLRRLRDGNPFVRAIAGQALWVLWSRSGDAEADRLLADGAAQMQAGNLEAAIETFGAVIRRRPAFAEGWNKRATAYYLAGDYQRSLADCDEVLKRNPRHFGALSGYGQVYFQLEQYEKAIAWWRRALEVNPNLEGLQENIEGAEALLRERRGRTI